MKQNTETVRAIDSSLAFARWVRVPVGTWIVALTQLWTAGGCSDGPFDYTPVHGTVTYDDGSIIPGGGFNLVFVALDVPAVETAHPRPAMAGVDGNGSFTCATSYKYGDGLIPGKHKVFIQSATEQSGGPVVPKDYMSELATPLVIDTEEVPLVIKVPKPVRKR